MRVKNALWQLAILGRITALDLFAIFYFEFSALVPNESRVFHEKLWPAKKRSQLILDGYLNRFNKNVCTFFISRFLVVECSLLVIEVTDAALFYS